MTNTRTKPLKPAPADPTMEELPQRTLDANDRCDAGACGARAYVEVELKTTGSLLFCGHHFHKAEVGGKIGQLALHINDQRDSILSTGKSVSGGAFA
jgi:hypothetical protein